MQVDHLVATVLDSMAKVLRHAPVGIHVEQDCTGVTHQPVRPVCNHQCADYAREYEAYDCHQIIEGALPRPAGRITLASNPLATHADLHQVFPDDELTGEIPLRSHQVGTRCMAGGDVR